jgi:hypothetical protein
LSTPQDYQPHPLVPRLVASTKARSRGGTGKVTRYTKYRNDAAIVGPPTSGKFKRLFSMYWKIFNPNYDFLLPLFGSKILKKMLLQMISGLMQPESTLDI